MTDEKLDPQEVEAEEPELLPKREVMSIIPTTGDWAGMEGISGAGAPAPAADSPVPPGGSDAASGAAGHANDSAGLAHTNADASGTGDDRFERGSAPDGHPVGQRLGRSVGRGR